MVVIRFRASYYELFVLIEKVNEFHPDFLLLIDILNLDLCFCDKVLNHLISIAHSDPHYLTSDLISEKVNPFFGFLKLLCFGCKHERVCELFICVKFMAAAYQLFDRSTIAPFSYVPFHQSVFAVI